MLPTRGSIILVSAALVAACHPAREPDPRLVSEWMHTIYGAIRVERLSPPVASRLASYATAALYSGFSATMSDLPPLTGTLNGFPEIKAPEKPRSYDPTLTAVTAERVVLDSLLREALPTTRAAIARLADSLQQSRIALGVDEKVQARSKSLGTSIGLAVVAWSRGDGFDSSRGRPYTPRVGDAYWVNDAPASIYAAQNLSGASQFVALDNPANVLQTGNASDRGLILSRPKNPGAKTLPAVNMAGLAEPYWGQIRPFVLENWKECPIPEPPAYSKEPGSPMYEDANTVAKTRRQLTPEERAIAYYWADNAGESGTPVGHWISIASQMISQRQLRAADAARLVVSTAVAQADAFIAAWGYKYQYSLLRPRTYIRRVIDSTWEPFIPTPPFPEYPSAHSTQSAAAATVLTSLIGEVHFDDSTGLSIGNAVRRFDSFQAAAAEAGISRIYAGIHFPYGNVGGQAVGKCIGTKVIERFSGTRAH
jgi:membrane-associated phospholipid phosphatase